jgi:hypothetical protein
MIMRSLSTMTTLSTLLLSIPISVTSFSWLIWVLLAASLGLRFPLHPMASISPGEVYSGPPHSCHSWWWAHYRDSYGA